MITFNTSLPRLVIKSLVLAIIISIIGYFIFPSLNSTEMGAQRIFTYTLMSGLFLGSVLSHISFNLNFSSNKVESIFVGNIAFKASANALRELFEQYGEVHAVRMMTDRVTRRPRGYAFVEMSAADAKQAIQSLDGTEFYGRELKVNVAHERKTTS